jgi:hypothetical protein
MDEDIYAFRVASSYPDRKGSRRSRVISALPIGKPLPLRMAYALAEREIPGLTLAEFKTDLRNHHDTEDCICIELHRRFDGTYVSVRSIPKPNRAFGFVGSIREGAVVIPRER